MLPFLRTLDIPGFHEKSIIQLAEVLILMNSIMNSIRDIIKTLQTYYFEYFKNA